MNTKYGMAALCFMLCAMVFLCIPAAALGDEDLVAYGNSLMTSKNYTLAVEAYNQAISINPDNIEAWNGKADALNRAQDFSEALAASDKVITLNPRYVPGWINRGYILYNLARYDDELMAYETAISIDPTSADAWFNKGYALAGLKRYDEAITAFDTVRSINPDFPNLAANRRIADQNRDAATPFYVKNAFTIAVIFLCIIGSVVWFVEVRKKY